MENPIKLREFGIYAVLIIAFTAITALSALATLPNYFGSAGHDSQWYIKLSEGRVSEVIQPFSGRILYPYLAGVIQDVFSFDASRSFFILGIASLFFFLIIAAFLARNVIPASTPFLIIPLLFLPYFIETTRELFLPDIFYIFLTAVLFLFLYRGMEGAGLITLFLLFLTRESTILPALILLALSAWRSKRMLFVGTLFVIVAGILVTGQIGAAGIPNPHHVSGSIYLALKFTYNFFNNFFGIQLWASTLAQNCEPVFRAALPEWSVFGSIREAGVCAFNSAGPIDSFLTLLTVFGVAPLVFFFAMYRKTKYILRDAPFWISFAAIYGLAYYIVGVPAGTGVMRIVGYGWPAFLLVVPYLAQFLFRIDRNFLIRLFLAHIIVAWLPYVARYTPWFTRWTAVALILISAVVYYSVFLLLKKQESLPII